ncbi:hypothetical protein pqer_cds_939 [Pandoravirus quercus]|uniref:Uncharacterized protein n=1 Tax=Pandoravirus quercus TaxID=2107709 RepID=A0A2U7UA90_9VIRU|nr:hypothetical protein pqer_cds_939 [Pandoravirus quercus]AVK75361.1 hypothetical protein pqer_cds_939 [Pandoravirus quercus]
MDKNRVAAKKEGGGKATWAVGEAILFASVVVVLKKLLGHWCQKEEPPSPAILGIDFWCYRESKLSPVTPAPDSDVVIQEGDEESVQGAGQGGNGDGGGTRNSIGGKRSRRHAGQSGQGEGEDPADGELGIVRLTSPADRNDSWTINLNDFSIAGARSSVFAKMERNEPSSFEVYGTFQGPPKQHFRVRLEEKHGTLVAGMTLGLGIQSGDAVPYHVTAPKKMESI